ILLVFYHQRRLDNLEGVALTVECQLDFGDFPGPRSQLQNTGYHLDLRLHYWDPKIPDGLDRDSIRHWKLKLPDIEVPVPRGHAHLAGGRDELRNGRLVGSKQPSKQASSTGGHTYPDQYQHD